MDPAEQSLGPSKMLPSQQDSPHKHDTSSPRAQQNVAAGLHVYSRREEMETVEDIDIYRDMRGKQRERKEKRREKRSEKSGK